MKKFGTPIGAAPGSDSEKVGLEGEGTPLPVGSVLADVPPEAAWLRRARLLGGACLALALAVAAPRCDGFSAPPGPLGAGVVEELVVVVVLEVDDDGGDDGVDEDEDVELVGVEPDVEVEVAVELDADEVEDEDGESELLVVLVLVELGPPVELEDDDVLELVLDVVDVDVVDVDDVEDGELDVCWLEEVVAVGDELVDDPGAHDSVSDRTMPMIGSDSEETGVSTGTFTSNVSVCPPTSFTVTVHASADAVGSAATAMVTSAAIAVKSTASSLCRLITGGILHQPRVLCALPRIPAGISSPRTFAVEGTGWSGALQSETPG